MRAQVGIGITSPNAGLDINSTTTGLLIPRVSLTNLLIEAPVLNPQGGAIPTSTLVYHDGLNAITAGFYYWDSTQWVMLTTEESNDWTITGNTGTSPATNFIGTIDNQDFVMRTNNTEKARIMSGGNFGIGLVNPLAKAHIFQPNTSTQGGILVQNAGTGSAISLFQTNSGTVNQALYIDQDGTDAFSRGIDIYMDTANPASGYSLFHQGTGRGIYTDLTNATNGSTGNALYHAGTGRGTFLNLSNTTNAATASTIVHDGIGTGEFISLTNAASTGTALSLNTDGTGRGQQISLGNATNAAIGLGVFHSGTGAGIISQTVGDAIAATTSGITATAGSFAITNTAADTNSIGMFISYNGSGAGGGAGGGNALEVQHNGTNGNAVDIFLGSPTTGEGSTTSEYTGLSVSQYANGTGTAGGVKSAISASSYGADPTIFVNNSGSEGGHGVLSQTIPGAPGMDPRAFYGYSYDATNPGLGYGGYFYGGLRGVYGASAPGGSTYGVFAAGDVGATGTKTFIIDHPLDPANKELRHFAIESNEVLNMYRGVVKLDKSGNATVILPEYFSAINKDATYQLTPIGTSSQPYIQKEITNNSFAIGGTPNTKVSWTIHAKRNDATLKYYDSIGGDYDNESRYKSARFKGKYHTPEAYGKSSDMAIDKIDHSMVKRAEQIELHKKAMLLKNEVKKLDSEKNDSKRDRKKLEKSKSL